MMVNELTPFITENQISAIVQRVVRSQKFFSQQDSALIFMDLSLIRDRIENLRKLFPPDTLHAIAIKANPLLSLQKFICTLGAGAEAATVPELFLAQQSGFSPDRIVYDSPAKTIEDLEYALSSGVHINADSFAELERIALLQPKYPNHGPVGIRINPQVGAGSISTTSVAAKYSKFGVPLTEFKEQLVECYRKYDWLTGVHLHVGSQGCNPEMLVKGVEIIVDFAQHVNETLESFGRRILYFDMGGGLPVSYHKDEPAITLSGYVNALRTRCPRLFDGRFRLITEFGRAIFASSGWVISRVEYIKKSEFVHTAVIHVGADLFLRRCYHPHDWYHEISVLDKYGLIKTGPPFKKYVLAGPLCFAGDILERDIKLPDLEEGDYIVIHDAGAYTLGMWSRHNSRQIPKVIGYEKNGEKLVVLKKRESLKEIVNFWS
jgi:diaminopimelate decarboxylase